MYLEKHFYKDFLIIICELQKTRLNIQERSLKKILSYINRLY